MSANKRMSSKYDMYDERSRELDDPMLDRQQENIIQQMIEMGLFDDFYNKGGRVGLQGGGGAYESWKDFVEPLMIKFPELEGMSNEEQVEFLRSKGMIRDDAFNTGGRVGYMGGGIMSARVGLQAGGVPPTFDETLEQIQGSTSNMEQQSMSLPSPQVQALQGIMGPHMARMIGTPIDTDAFAPQAAAQTELQQQAAQQAATQAGLGTLQFDESGMFTGIEEGTGTGIAGYQKFLDQAATDFGGASAAAAAGQGAGTAALGQAGTAMDAAQQAAVAGQDAGAQYMGPQAYEQFMSPYQQEVIDATMAGYDQKMAEQQAKFGVSGGQAFGGSRFGVAQGQLGAQGALDRAQAQANLLSQGYQNAQMAASQAFGQAQQMAGQNVNMYGQVGQGQMGLAGAQQGQAAQNVGLYGTAGQAQQGLAALQPQLAQQAWAGLGQVGQGQQGQIQAGLDTAAQAAQTAAYEPLQRMTAFGQNLAAMGGGGSNYAIPQATPQTSPMSNLITGIGSGMSIGNMFGGWG